MARKKECIAEENTSDSQKNDFVENKETCKKCASKGSGILVFFLTLLLIISMAGFAWAFMSYKNSESKVAKLSSPEGQQELAKKEIKDLVLKVSRHLVLPKDEEPTVANILDAAVLAKDQPFYKDAHNGDRVLIYVKAQKAIVYDEIRDILVNVGPVYIENQNQEAKAQPNTVQENEPNSGN